MQPRKPTKPSPTLWRYTYFAAGSGHVQATGIHASLSANYPERFRLGIGKGTDARARFGRYGEETRLIGE